jgi:hypothetical protein
MVMPARPSRRIRRSRCRRTYLRVDRWGPKVVVWVEVAGWWCLSLFLIRRVTPPSLPGMTPMACHTESVPGFQFVVSCHSCEIVDYMACSNRCGKRTLLAIWPSFCPKSVDCGYTSNADTYLAAVDVPQVEGVARELDAVGPLDKRCAVSLCPQSVPNPTSSCPADAITHW